MAEFPIIVSRTAMALDEESMKEMHEQFEEEEKREEVRNDEFIAYDFSKNTIMHENNFTREYLKYVDNIDPAICSSLGYTRLVNMNLIRKIDDEVKPVTISSAVAGMTGNITSTSNLRNSGMSSYPIQLNKEQEGYLQKYYDVLYGSYPSNEKELVLVIDEKNRVGVENLSNLGFDVKDEEKVKFSEIVGTQFKLVQNNDYYVETEFETYIPNTDYEEMYESKNSITLEVVGVIKLKEDSEIGLLSAGLAYSDSLSQLIIDNEVESDIVKVQKEVDYNVINRENVTDEEKEMLLSTLGGNSTPFMIMIYPNGFNEKDEITAYLDKYNEGKEKEDTVVYQDLASTISNMTSGIMTGITTVLIAFAAISLVVSLIMIAIIIYISVLERTKEIGILKSLGARKKDITRVFDAETCILRSLFGITWSNNCMATHIPNK
jgi:putative ABC transport system permease protein